MYPIATPIPHSTTTRMRQFTPHSSSTAIGYTLFSRKLNPYSTTHNTIFMTVPRTTLAMRWSRRWSLNRSGSAIAAISSAKVATNSQPPQRTSYMAVPSGYGVSGYTGCGIIMVPPSACTTSSSHVCAFLYQFPRNERFEYFDGETSSFTQGILYHAKVRIHASNDRMLSSSFCSDDVL